MKGDDGPALGSDPTTNPAQWASGWSRHWRYNRRHTQATALRRIMDIVCCDLSVSDCPSRDASDLQ